MDSQATLTRELALRIGLAAHALPDTDAKRLLSVLTDCIGLPFTDANIADLTLTAFKTALSGEFSALDDGIVFNALHILQTGSAGFWESAADDNATLPPGSVRIACTTDDGINVNGHFGSCRLFMIFQLSADNIRLVAIRDPEVPEGLVVDDKNLYRAELIQDCQVLYTAAVGGPAAAKIVKLGIHPIKLPDVENIQHIIKQLQQVIADAPPPWLAKVMGIAAADRFKFAREATG